MRNDAPWTLVPWLLLCVSFPMQSMVQSVSQAARPYQKKRPHEWVMITASKEEVRWRGTMYNTVSSARSSVMDGKVKQAQNFSLTNAIVHCEKQNRWSHLPKTICHSSHGSYLDALVNNVSNSNFKPIHNVFLNLTRLWSHQVPVHLQWSCCFGNSINVVLGIWQLTHPVI